MQTVSFNVYNCAHDSLLAALCLAYAQLCASDDQADETLCFDTIADTVNKGLAATEHEDMQRATSVAQLQQRYAASYVLQHADPAARDLAYKAVLCCDDDTTQFAHVALQTILVHAIAQRDAYVNIVRMHNL